MDVGQLFNNVIPVSSIVYDMWHVFVNPLIYWINPYRNIIVNVALSPVTPIFFNARECVEEDRGDWDEAIVDAHVCL